MRKCSLEGCNELHRALGLCQKHYKKLRKYGNPLAGKSSSDYRYSCKALGCKEPHLAKGYCNKHYKRKNYKYKT